MGKATVLLSDGECIGLCLDGHLEAYEELVARYEVPLISHLSGRLADGDLAEEAAHEAFVRAYFALDTLRKRESFFPWLAGIADHIAKDELRHRKRQHEMDGNLAAADASTSRPDRDLERAVADLAEPYREVVLMRFFGGMQCDAIAKTLGLSLGTITKRLSRAYTMLRESLERPEKAEADKEARE